jgi:hypothetical protein
MRTPRIVQRLRPRRTRQLAWREAMTGLDRRWEHARLVERFRRWGMWVVIAAGAAGPSPVKVGTRLLITRRA